MDLENQRRGWMNLLKWSGALCRGLPKLYNTSSIFSAGHLIMSSILLFITLSRRIVLEQDSWAPLYCNTVLQLVPQYWDMVEHCIETLFYKWYHCIDILLYKWYQLIYWGTTAKLRYCACGTIPDHVRLSEKSCDVGDLLPCCFDIYSFIFSTSSGDVLVVLGQFW